MSNSAHFQAAADEYGNLKAQIDALTEKLEAAKATLKASGMERVEGERFTVTVSTSTRTTYDDKAIRAALGEDICKQYERQTDTVTLRVKATAVFAQAAA